MALVLYKMAGSPNVVYRNVFSDVSGYAYLNAYLDYNQVSDYANRAVQWAVHYDIMGNDQYLWPLDNIYRRDVALMIYKFLCL